MKASQQMLNRIPHGQVVSALQCLYQLSFKQIYDRVTLV